VASRLRRKSRGDKIYEKVVAIVLLSLAEHKSLSLSIIHLPFKYMSKNVIITIAAVLVVILGLWYALSSPSKYTPPVTPSNTSLPPIPPSPESVNTPPSAAGQGRVVFVVKDAAMASMQGVTSVIVTVDSVKVHGAVQGWTTVSATQKKYDLLQLKQSGGAALLADATIPAGTYDQIRLDISNVEVKTGTKTQMAKLPSSTLNIIGKLVVTEGKTSTVSIDFMADKSLHLTGKGVYILAPVVKLEIKSGVDVQVKSDESVMINGGNVEEEKNEGMDQQGETKVDFVLKGDLDVDGNNVIQIKNGVGAGNEITLTFGSKTNSAFFGTAMLQEENGKVNVALKLDTNMASAYAFPEPAHIHVGSCPNVGGVKYALNDIVGGKSETVINASMADLKAGLPLAINVHKSASESTVYIACANVKF